MRQDRPELIGVGAASWVGHVLGTVGCLSEGYSIRYCIGDSEKTVVNLEAVEWMCRCGLYPYLPALHDEVEYIKNSIDKNGICRADVDERILKNISTYSGLQIEKDWKSETRQLCDITFRALLILKFANLLEQ